MSDNHKGVVLLSGGMDSTLSATLASKECREIAALHLNYRHRTERRELRAFHDVADALAIEKRLVVDLEFLRQIGGSSLTDDSIPVSAANLASTEIPSSYVPFRNGNFLSVASSWAEVLGFDRIYIGAVEEDSSGYPDCRRSFFDAFETALNIGTRPETRISIVTPLIAMSKAEIVAKALAMNAPIEKSWSCYTSEDLACGACDSCALRLRGFARAGAEDPVEYKSRPLYQ